MWHRCRRMGRSMRMAWRRREGRPRRWNRSATVIWTASWTVPTRAIRSRWLSRSKQVEEIKKQEKVLELREKVSVLCAMRSGNLCIGWERLSFKKLSFNYYLVAQLTVRGRALSFWLHKFLIFSDILWIFYQVYTLGVLETPAKYKILSVLSGSLTVSLIVLRDVYNKNYSRKDLKKKKTSN